MTMIRGDMPFPADYEARILEEQPVGAVHHEFGRTPQPSARSAVLVEVTPEVGESWVGIVKKPSPTIKAALSGVFPTPNRRRLCIVAGGDAYLIDVDHPDQFEVLDSGGPVVEVVGLVQAGLLLLLSPWVVTALNANGRAWQTGRLAINGLRLDEVSEGQLVGVADPADEESKDFVIDLRSGRHEGGVPFP